MFSMLLKYEVMCKTKNILKAPFFGKKHYFILVNLLESLNGINVFLWCGVVLQVR